MSEIVVDVEHLKKYYPVGKKTLRAVDDVTFSIEKGQIFGVVGESGSGKSTLGQCILRLADVTDGSIRFEGKDITRLNQQQLKDYRRYMQVVFQNPYSSFNPKMTIGQAFTEVGKVHKRPAPERHAKIKELLDYISLTDDVLQRRPNELSGGQLQRLAFARALLLDPHFIVADEPTSSLDVSIQAQILNLILDLREKLGLTMMFISHELTVVEHICDVVAVMYLGTIVEMAPKTELFGTIGHPYTEALLSAKPKDTPDQKTERIILEGDVPSAVDLPAGCRFGPRCPKFVQGTCDVSSPPLVQVKPRHFVACHLVQEL
jgi:peptide/nickel transport system ATP-binding protein/oligopeptide transport system ATP-binding protein